MSALATAVAVVAVIAGVLSISLAGTAHRTLSTRHMADFERRFGKRPTANVQGVRKYAPRREDA